MKIVGKYIKHLFNAKHQAELTFQVYNYKHIQMLNELDDKDYILTIKEVKSKRSINQNAFLWAMLHELEQQSDQDKMDWYIHALEQAQSKVEYILGLDGIQDNLINSFRAVKKIGKRMVDDKELTMYKCFYGSSKFTIKEMNQLLDIVIGYCHEYNIDTELMRIE